MKRFIPVALVIGLTSVACDNSSGATSPTTSPATNTITLTGTVPAAVNGVPQSQSQTFTVGQNGGTVTLTLTSAVETLAGGTLNPSVVVGLGVGTMVGGTCTVTPGTTQLLSASATPLTGTLMPGTWCLQVTNEDASAQSGPVTYTVVIVTP